MSVKMTGKTRAGAKYRSSAAPLSAVLGAVLILAACRQRPVPATQPDADQAAVSATLRRYVAASNAGDAAALADLYTEDALLLPPDEEPVLGRAAIRAFWNDGTEPGMTVRTIRTVVRNGLSYVAGRYNLPATDSEAADSGKYLLALERQPDGRWAVAVDIWNRSTADSSADEAGDELPPVTRIERYLRWSRARAGVRLTATPRAGRSRSEGTGRR
jgi:uncharacterized protein (TIGR02246 family)